MKSPKLGLPTYFHCRTFPFAALFKKRHILLNSEWLAPKSENPTARRLSSGQVSASRVQFLTTVCNTLWHQCSSRALSSTASAYRQEQPERCDLFYVF